VCSVRSLLVLVLASACTPEVVHSVDYRYAGGRVAFQTDARQIAVVDTDLGAPYDVLADLEVTLRQRTAFGELPTRERAREALREQAARIGAHAVVMTSFGEIGSSWWSYNELRGHGRAIRFR
jgi:hypothetical protein